MGPNYKGAAGQEPQKEKKKLKNMNNRAAEQTRSNGPKINRWWDNGPKKKKRKSRAPMYICYIVRASDKQKEDDGQSTETCVRQHRRKQSKDKIKTGKIK